MLGCPLSMASGMLTPCVVQMSSSRPSISATVVVGKIGRKERNDIARQYSSSVSFVNGRNRRSPA
jgi:hypothetical protein